MPNSIADITLYTQQFLSKLKIYQSASIDDKKQIELCLLSIFLNLNIFDVIFVSNCGNNKIYNKVVQELKSKNIIDEGLILNIDFDEDVDEIEEIKINGCGSSELN